MGALWRFMHVQPSRRGEGGGEEEQVNNDDDGR